MPRIVVLLAIAVVTALAAATASAHAAAPVHEWVAIDERFTFDCGFPVEEHFVATLHLVSWFDESGARTRQIVTAPGAGVTWTNRVTGTSVTTANPFAVHKRDNPDGSTTIAFTGLRFALHGQGRAYVDSGREVILFSPGSFQLLSSAGPSADLCEALAATIG